jgi:hypothetical protein
MNNKIEEIEINKKSRELGLLKDDNNTTIYSVDLSLINLNKIMPLPFINLKKLNQITTTSSIVQKRNNNQNENKIKKYKGKYYFFIFFYFYFHFDLSLIPFKYHTLFIIY